ncbi:MAG TPA: D-alanine--D-alanine ligase A, partial [Patescibacteria group bacterium]|nr:D-alanine--D-alanine ligase A [Patescibacteria group bacterium]
LGSSVGVSKVTTEEELTKAVADAFQYDMKILIEAALVGREVECAVLGGRTPQASGIGEIVPKEGTFYSYEAKYIDADGAQLIIPAVLPEDTVSEIQRMAIVTFQTLECSGLGRVDFFVTNNGVFVNEINTFPGFTSISMYPKLWEENGIGYADLLHRLIALGRQRFQETKALKKNAI